MLQVGQSAPTFDLPDGDMNLVSLNGYRGVNNVVLYFYPKDDTPGCTLEAIDFSDLEDEFLDLDTVVLGVSMDDCMSHGAFRDKHDSQCSCWQMQKGKSAISTVYCRTRNWKGIRRSGASCVRLSSSTRAETCDMSSTGSTRADTRPMF